MIFYKNSDICHFADHASVSQLELRSPGASEDDERHVITSMRTHNLFPKIQEQRRRKRIQKQIKKVYVLILTIYTLFEDIKYLRSAQHALKQILLLSI